jgi:hypothetical protein
LTPSPDTTPSFHDAVACLRSYLKANGRPEKIVWVEPDDLLKVKTRLRVRLRPPHRMWTKAQCTYELGVDRKLGVLLQQLCQIPGLSCCHVYIPKNSQDAEQRLNGCSLKLSFPDELRRATAVTNGLHWALLKMSGSRLLS